MMVQELSNDALGDAIVNLRNSERRQQVDFLRYLREVEKRDLHLEWGFSSLFTYLVRGLGYSEGSAASRVGVSRVAEGFPRVLDMLGEGRTNLTSLRSVAKLLTAENADSILQEIAGKTSREVEVIACSYRAPVKAPVERITPVRVAAKFEREAPVSLFDSSAAGKSTASAIPTKSFCNPQGSSGSAGSGSKSADADVSYQLRCTLSAGTQRKLNLARALMTHTLKGDASLERTLEVLLDTYLQKHGHEEKAERAMKRKASTGRMRSVKSLMSVPQKRVHIPAALKREVLSRDGYACSFVSSDGTCCGKKEGLELDHVLPVAMGGKNTKENLRVLCREHNQFFARKVFGREFMKRKVMASE